jgi:NADH dehydrogenase FAD-containing subunit
MVTEVTGDRLVISDRTKLPTRTVVWCVGVRSDPPIGVMVILGTPAAHPQPADQPLDQEDHVITSE